MSAVAAISQRLVDGELLSKPLADDHARRWREQPNSRDDGAAFLAWLAENNVITPFQAEALQAGHSPPFILGPYRVFDRLTDSDLGHVYRAVHAELELPVSLKVFPPGLDDKPASLARMQREARASVELDHPHVLRIFQVGRAGSIYLLASQNLSGESLEDWLFRDTRLDCVPACKVVRQAALGLQHLHERQMIHRNICPQTLWVSDNGAVKIIGLDWVRDTDGSFGIDDPPDSAERQLVGNLVYIAPEQAVHPDRPDARSDIFALGGVFYHALAGTAPFAGRQVFADVDVADAAVPQLAEAAPETPDDIVDLVTAMLSADPGERPALGEVVAVCEAHLNPGELELVDADAIPPELMDWLDTSDGGETGETLFAGTSFTDWLAE